MRESPGEGGGCDDHAVQRRERSASTETQGVCGCNEVLGEGPRAGQEPGEVNGGKARHARPPKELPKGQGSYRWVLNGRKHGHVCSGRQLGGRRGRWRMEAEVQDRDLWRSGREHRMERQDVTGLGDRLQVGVGKRRRRGLRGEERVAGKEPRPFGTWSSVDAWTLSRCSLAGKAGVYFSRCYCLTFGALGQKMYRKAEISWA